MGLIIKFHYTQIICNFQFTVDKILLTTTVSEQKIILLDLNNIKRFLTLKCFRHSFSKIMKYTYCSLQPPYFHLIYTHSSSSVKIDETSCIHQNINVISSSLHFNFSTRKKIMNEREMFKFDSFFIYKLVSLTNPKASIYSYILPWNKL